MDMANSAFLYKTPLNQSAVKHTAGHGDSIEVFNGLLKIEYIWKLDVMKKKAYEHELVTSWCSWLYYAHTPISSQ